MVQEPPLRIEELLVPTAFPHAVSQLRVVETAISWIVLTGALAYKVKKPVLLEFIDTSTLERRQYCCNEELRLNRRLAPELYLQVVPITRSNGCAQVGGTGTPIEYAVCLKQFAPDQELPALLENADVSVPQIAQLGETLAYFHLQTPEYSGMHAPDVTERMYETVLGNLEQLADHAKGSKDLPELGRLWNWTRAAIDSYEGAFELRERTHRIRDCHGDLHAANIVRFAGRLVPFDCIDFDPRLRWIDVMNDIAFLIMDLYSRRRADLAAALLNRYLEITGDYDGVRLLPFYAVYRALVRAKVDAVAVEQSPHLAAQFIARMQRRVHTALDLIQQPAPLLLLMHGMSGSGKSWLSQQLVAPLRALRIRSDLERHRLMGASLDDAGFKRGNYAPEISHRVYARLVECAESCLQAGFNVIVDASFLDAADRELFTGLADRMRLRCAVISCGADAKTLSARVAARAARGDDVSEANLNVLDAQLRDYKPLEGDVRHPIVQVDTGEVDVLENVIGAVRALSTDDQPATRG